MWGEKHYQCVILLLQRSHESCETETGKEMCKGEAIAQEGENGDVEKRSSTNLASLPLHLMPSLSRTASAVKGS